MWRVIFVLATGCALLLSEASAVEVTADSFLVGQVWPPSPADKVVRISGIYPHLTVFNGDGECGVGAIMPWANKLWFITYPPHSWT